MNDIKHFLNIVEGVPSTFTATHFHKNNFGGKTSLMYNPADGNFYVQRQGGIERWFGDVNSRGRLSAASVDGEIVDGKFVDYPEGKTFADMEKEKQSNATSADAANSTSPWGGRPQSNTSQSGMPGVVPAPGGKDGAPPASSPRPQQRPATRGPGSSSQTPGVQGDRLTLSDGSSFRKEPNSQNLLNQKASQLVDRMVALLRKMNESVPVSMRGYIVESGIAELLLEALNDAETQELKTIYADLRAIERSNFLLRPQNQQNLKRFLDREGAKIDALVVAAGGNSRGMSDPAADAQADDAARQPGLGSATTPRGSADPTPAAQANPDGGETPPGLASATTPRGSADPTPAAQANPDGGETPPAGSTTSSDTDFSSDESIQKAIKDPESWIANEMPVELAKYNARGLSKAGRGRKSASVAAVQQVMLRLNAVTNDPVFKIQVDGQIGGKTREAIKAAQELAGITVDGDPGADTAKQLVDFAKNPTAAGGMGEKRIIRDVERAIELLKKQSGGSQQNSSIDFRNLIRIVESKLLNEALSDAEKKELDDILARLKAKLDDGEYIDGLKGSNPDLHTKFKELQQLQSGKTPPPAAQRRNSADPAADAQADDAARPPLAGSQGPRTSAAVAAQQSADAGTLDPEAATFLQDTPTAALQIWRAPGVMNDDEQAVFDVMKDVVKSERVWTQLQQDFKNLPQNRNKIELVPYLQDFLNDDEMTRFVWDPLASNGVRPRGAGATTDTSKVPARPTGHRGLMQAWDRRYGATHNPDGTPKGGSAAPAAATRSDPAADAQADDAARSRPAAPAASSSSIDQLRAELAGLDISKQEDARKLVQIYIQNDELMQELTPDDQRRVRAAAEAQGIR